MDFQRKFTPGQYKFCRFIMKVIIKQCHECSWVCLIKQTSRRKTWKRKNRLVNTARSGNILPSAWSVLGKTDAPWRSCALLPKTPQTNTCLTQWLCPRSLSFDSPTISSHTAAVRSKEQEAKTCPNSGWAHVTRHTDPLCVWGII